MSLSGGNAVDRLPPARHTKAFGVPHGGLAPIDKLDPEKSQIKRASYLKLPERSVGACYCIVRCVRSWISEKIIDEIMISIPVRIFNGRAAR